MAQRGTLPAASERPSNGRRVAMVYPRPTFDSVPSLCAMAELLARAGYLVDVFMRTAGHAALPHFSSRNVSVVSLGPETPTVPPPSQGFTARRFVSDARRFVQLARARRFNHEAARHLADCRQWVRMVHSVCPYVCFIGVDADGLVLAEDLASEVGAAIATVSLELLLSSAPLTVEQRALKDRERTLCRRIAFAVVQDPDRGRLFVADNNVAADRLLLVPNAPLGPSRRAPSDALRGQFGLAPEKRIALHAGSLGDWTGIERIVQSVRNWPEPWVLVVHTRYDAQSSPYVERLRARAPRDRVFFSLRPLPRQEYDRLVDGADAGVAFYVPAADATFTGDNVQTMGLSSGKLAYYARAGLPVVVNNATSVGDLVRESGCGEVVENAEDVGRALALIAARPGHYSERASHLFDERLDVARAFQAVLARLDALPLAA